MDTKRFVRKIWQSLPRETPQPETGKWAMLPNVIWLRRPEMWCPHCEVSWINPWTWLVHLSKAKVLRVWSESGESLYLGDVHPHVMSGGEICLGDGSVIEALTSGFNFNSCFDESSFTDLMANLGHRNCVQEDENNEGQAYCERCESYFDEDDVEWYGQAYQYLCDSCWMNQSICCDDCGDRFYYPDEGYISCPLTEVRGGDMFCGECLDNGYSFCEDCEEFVYNDDMKEWSADEDPICKRCWQETSEICEECLESVGKNAYNSDYSMCISCFEKGEEKVCTNCSKEFWTDELGEVTCEDCGTKGVKDGTDDATPTAG